MDLCLPGHILLPALKKPENRIRFSYLHRSADPLRTAYPSSLLLFLSKIVLDVLLWDGIELNYRPPPYQSGALTN